MPPHVPNADRMPTVQVNIQPAIDAVSWYPTVRALRWPDGLMSPSCQLKYSTKRGCDDTALARQHYGCHDDDTRCDPICRPTHVSSSCTLFGPWPCTSHLLIMKACRRCSSRARWRLVRVTHRVIGDTGVAVKQVLEL